MPASLRIALARRAITGGGVIAYPTEGVFGLGCDPLNGHAVARIFELKSRAPNKGLILLAANVDQLAPFVLPPPPDLTDALRETWPGPVTWLMPAHPGVPAWITGGRDTIAVRVTAHAQCRALCLAAATALVSTSANISGRAPARTSTAVRLQFGDALDYLVPGQLGGLAGPSEIRDGRTGAVVRAATP